MPPRRTGMHNLQNMTGQTFYPAPQDNNQPSDVSSMYDGGISIETYSAGAGRDVASMVDNEQLKCTATLLQYITSESAVSTDEFFRAFATIIL